MVPCPKCDTAPPTSNPLDELGRLRWLEKLFRANTSAYVHDVLETYDRYWPKATADETDAVECIHPVDRLLPVNDQMCEFICAECGATVEMAPSIYRAIVRASDKSEPPHE